MSMTRKSTSAALALSVALPALAFATPALADGYNEYGASSQYGASSEISYPPLTAPVVDNGTSGTAKSSISFGPNGEQFIESTSTSIGADGVETITRTRKIIRPAPNQHTPHQLNVGYPGYPLAPAPVFERDEWLAECDRRTSGRSEKEKGGIIGGLLGAIGGGVAGNLIAGAGDRLAGTLIGAGTGGLAGLLLGSLIGSGKKGDRYDCEAALDGYLSQYGQPGAVRTIPYPYAPAGYHYAHTGHYNYSSACGCQQPQFALVPIRTEVRQRVIVRERVYETEVPGERIVVPPRPPRPVKPSPKMIKQ